METEAQLYKKSDGTYWPANNTAKLLARLARQKHVDAYVINGSSDLGFHWQEVEKPINN